ncbi:MAG: NlpC/P60 family protein [Calditerrivibrio sp.]|nr:NlpC/P60 family protein [Calditerrivibrio sp.]
MKVKKLFYLLLFIVILGSGCSTKGFVKADRIQFTIQAGAFADINNVEAFINKLSARGLDPYYFKDDNNLYKVRFGNFYTYQGAQYTAEKLKGEQIIDDYIIVSYENIRQKDKDFEYSDDIREKVVNTAISYIGTPYIKGGNDNDGFDCSGFVQTVFRMNGIELPRTSMEQFKKGYELSGDLKRGDLVFFKINGKTVSHVGIYLGDGKFIHAPRVKSKVRVEDLSLPYYQKRYIGAKTYLQYQDVTAIR